jgi:hypothetical protein
MRMPYVGRLELLAEHLNRTTVKMACLLEDTHSWHCDWGYDCVYRNIVRIYDSHWTTHAFSPLNTASEYCIWTQELVKVSRF